MTKIKVCVVDDHTLVRKLLTKEVAKFERCDPDVQEAGNGKELLHILKAREVDVILLDIRMPVMDGRETARWILKKYKKVKIVILTMNDNTEPMIELLAMGVHAYILKDCLLDEIEAAIYNVYDHDFYSNDLSTMALRIIARQNNILRTERLTDREKEIVRLICEEMTMTEIAKQLNVSERTVENHRTNILRKLHARNTVGIVKYAYQTGLLPT